MNSTLLDGLFRKVDFKNTVSFCQDILNAIANVDGRRDNLLILQLNQCQPVLVRCQPLPCLQGYTFNDTPCSFLKMPARRSASSLL